ncbi:glycosyltransferase family 2 protein [Erythrobacter litoralis]|uniref:glycosyltransferase family 2 protein n=1 Tax=Erythrobacter litoralis TaxID=39960 RepID=UPI002434858D|nr:glycosyltransferase family 2 protein [Erythrobacter litoralis]MDG6079101.1 glycosyltransferase family 2 protein [Erythrobacter litoralis]
MAVIAVNYRSPEDTIECLASLFSGERVPYVIVADNASGDGSLETIAAWAKGERETRYASEFHRNEATAAIRFPIECDLRGPDDLDRPIEKPLTLIDTGANLGFAGGNNRGLQVAAGNPAVELLWLLNNDTTVGPETVGMVIDAFGAHPEWGMAGTPVRLYHEPHTHQLVNGMRFNKLTGTGRGIGAGSAVDTKLDPDAVARQTDFVCGASLIMSREFFEDVGYLEERFFLFYEEIDLATRGKQYPIGFIPDAVVYHKEGASAGSSSRLQARSPLAEYHHIRSKMLFVRKHYPLLLPLYFAQNLVIVARRLMRRQPPQAKATARATFGLPLR